MSQNLTMRSDCIIKPNPLQIYKPISVIKALKRHTQTSSYATIKKNKKKFLKEMTYDKEKEINSSKKWQLCKILSQQFMKGVHTILNYVSLSKWDHLEKTGYIIKIIFLLPDPIKSAKWQEHLLIEMVMKPTVGDISDTWEKWTHKSQGKWEWWINWTREQQQGSTISQLHPLEGKNSRRVGECLKHNQKRLSNYFSMVGEGWRMKYGWWPIRGWGCTGMKKWGGKKKM